MIRPLTLVTLCAAAGAGLYLYQVKHAVSQLDRELRDINRRTEQARERTQVLRAEWALLNEPDRLRQVAQRHLPLDAMTPTQFVRQSDIERRVPAPRQFAGAPSLFAPTEPPGDGSATSMAIANAEPRGLPQAATLAAAAAAVATPAPPPVVTSAPVMAAPTPAPAAPATQPSPPAPTVVATAEPARAPEPAPRPAPAPRVAAPRPATPVQSAMHVEPRPQRPAPRPTVTAAAAPPAATSSLGGFSALGGSGMPALAPPVPIARAAAATLPR